MVLKEHADSFFFEGSVVVMIFRYNNGSGDWFFIAMEMMVWIRL